MKSLRAILVLVVVVVAALAGAVMSGTADAGKPATYYACADAATGVLRRVDPEVRCAEGEERLVWSDGEPEPTPRKSTSCTVAVSTVPFSKMTDVPFQEIAATAPCETRWDGAARVTIRMSVALARIADPRPDWLTDEYVVAMVYLVNAPDCAGCHESFNAGVEQPTYAKCKDSGPVCTLEFSYTGVTTVTSGTPIRLFLEARLESTKYQDAQGDVVVYDDSIVGATLSATGTMPIEQVAP